MITIRCSSLPRIMSCPASLEVGEVQIQSSSDNASIGTAVHEVMADIIRKSLSGTKDPQGFPQMPELYPYADRHGVEVDDIRFLCWRGLEIWKQYAPMLQNVEVEREYATDISEEIELTGHPDVTATLESGQGVIIDWKTGTDRESFNQLIGYAALCFTGNTEGVKVIVANLRENMAEVRNYESDQIDEFGDKISSVVRSGSNQYNPTVENCQYCPRRISGCPAREIMVQSAMSALYPLGTTESKIENVRRLGEIYKKSKVLEKALEEYSSALKIAIRDSGEITLPDGLVLKLEECERETITADIGFFRTCYSMLHDNDHEGNYDSPECTMEIIGSNAFTVKKKEVIKAVRSAAPKGEKDAAEERFMKELRAAGCVKTTKFEKIVCMKE